MVVGSYEVFLGQNYVQLLLFRLPHFYPSPIFNGIVYVSLILVGTRYIIYVCTTFSLSAIYALLSTH